VGLVGQAVSQVFYERAARLRDRPEELRLLLNRTLAALGAVAALMLAGAVALSPWVFTRAFGASWAGAGSYAQLLAPAVAVGLVTSPVSMLPAVLDQQHVHLAISSLAYAARVVGIAVGLGVGSAPVAVFCFGMGEALVGIVFLGWLWWHTRSLARRAGEVAP
jgi:O-antigen/teichoic acid export membrane protein